MCRNEGLTVELIATVNCVDKLVMLSLKVAQLEDIEYGRVRLSAH